ncbi:site-specific integrase [Aneurinibacillus sp. BA2021]|nr:site-specific integrase [Aneurinibacillus sp. BA2021]
MKVWGLDEVNQFLEKGKNIGRYNGNRYFIGFALALLTGMRQGEILGLRWSDIDLREGIIYVKQTLTHDGKKLQQGTKTASSNRSIHIPTQLLNELLLHKQQYERERDEWLKGGKQWHEYGLVICTKEGKPVFPTNFFKAFKRTVEYLNLPNIRFHDTRHTHATLLLTKNIHPKLVSERLGHSRIGITLDTYSHVLPSMQKEVANELEKMLTVTS